uniref:Zinc finger BED domain-containing protein 1 n=1 Tax=Cacopsylla melanoneura TaxID=428564 RepID=A0A8D8YWJ7_9HEMI
MEMMIIPKRPSYRKSQSTKRKIDLKQESDQDYGEDDYHNISGSSLIQKAVDTIMYDEGDDDDEHHMTMPQNKAKTKKPPAKPKKKFVEPDTDQIIFHKVSIPQTMRSIYWKYFGFPADMNGEVVTKRKIICTLCNNQLAYVGNTTNIKSHLSHKHPMQYARLIQNAGMMGDTPTKKKKKDMNHDEMFQVIDVKAAQSNQDGQYSICVQGDEGEQAIISIPQTHIPGGNKKRSAVHNKSLIDLIVNFVILDLQPPSIVSSDGFRYLVANLAAGCGVPTEQSIIQEVVPKMYDTLLSLSLSTYFIEIVKQ